MAGSPAGIKGYMDIAYLSTLSCRIGCRRPDVGRRDLARRDDLYKEFIAAASKAYGETIVSNEPNVQEFVALYAMISRMRVQSPPQMLQQSRDVSICAKLKCHSVASLG